jgi:hypothetical protein
MTYFLHYFALLLKYVLVANVVDPGYSNSRDLKLPHWRWEVVKHVAIQGLFTCLALYGTPWEVTVFAVALEWPLLYTGTIIERHAPSRQMGKSYLTAQLLLVYGYATVTLFYLILKK